MRVGVPTEIKTLEKRVGLIPSAVRELTDRGHSVLVQSGAGSGVGAEDAKYQAAGAEIAAEAQHVWAESEMIVKVKEPQAPERACLRPDQLLFTYLHLAPDPEQAADLVASGATCIAYETVTDRSGGLPLLAPMSQVAGRLSVQAGARCLESPAGGSGTLLGGVPGVAAASVVVIGGGVVGENAIQMAAGLGAHVTVFDRNLHVLDRLEQRFGPTLQTLYSTTSGIENAVAAADLVVGAVLVVSRSEKRHRKTTRRLVEHGPAQPLRGNAHRFSFIFILPSPRVFSPHPLQFVGAGNGKRRTSRRF